MSNATIDRLESERQSQVDFVEQTLSKVDEEKRDLVEAEKRNLESARDRIKELDEQLKPLKEFDELRSAHRAGGNFRPAPSGGSDQGKSLGAQTNVRAHEYASAGEFLADAWRAKTQGDPEAVNRLASLGRSIGRSNDAQLELADVAVARAADAQYVASLNGAQRASAPNVTTVEIPGVMPVSVVGPLLNDIDAERPFLNSIGVKDMGNIPGKTFTRPVITEHVQMGTQSSEKSAVQAGQFKIDDVDFTKSTEGGYVDVSRQSIDWSSPTMWNALLQDFLDIYARHTENKAADAFVVSVQTGDVVDTETAGASAALGEYIAALYNGAVQVYGDTQSMPNHVWMSLDIWASMGILLDTASASAAGQGVGSSDVGNFQAGGILTLPRTVVPAFPSGTFIIGRRQRYEAYEDRLGFLSAVEPKLLGIELAYGGYIAANVLDADAFAELTFTPATP